MSLVNRAINVLKADIPTFNEIEHDPGATTEAAIIVGVTGLIGALGSMAAGRQLQQLTESLGGVEGMEQFTSVLRSTPVGASSTALFISGLVGAFATWFVWSWLTAFVGTRFFGGQGDTGEMLRVLGYARIPQVLSFIPCVGFLAAIWSLYLGFVAVREGMDLDNGKALLTILVSIIPAWIVSGLISTLISGIF
jgi:hypothetical protein